jgi:hypothetical protein
MILQKFKRGMDAIEIIAEAKDSGWKNAAELLDSIGFSEDDVADWWFDVGEVETSLLMVKGSIEEAIVNTMTHNRVYPHEEKMFITEDRTIAHILN